MPTENFALKKFGSSSLYTYINRTYMKKFVVAVVWGHIISLSYLLVFLFEVTYILLKTQLKSKIVILEFYL